MGGELRIENAELRILNSMHFSGLGGGEGLSHFVEGALEVVGGNEKFELEMAKMDRVTIAQKVFTAGRDAALVDIGAVPTAEIQDV